MKRTLIELNVNDEAMEVPVRGTDTLLDALRDGLQLTGSKRGCDQGVCGACTVLIDGLPARACLTLGVDATDRRITTIEGLATEETAGRLQQALVSHGAVQCGYCTPGIIVSLLDLARRGGGAAPEDVRQAISGNICRCSGYVKIVEAACAALGGEGVDGR